MPARFSQEALAPYIKQAAQPPQARPAGDRSIGWGPYAAHAAGEGADLLTTLMAITSGRGREGNPVLGNSPAKLAAIKGGGAVALAYLMKLLDDKGHDKAAKLIGYINGAAKGGIAARNTRVGR